jgi:hypothetical protein
MRDNGNISDNINIIDELLGMLNAWYLSLAEMQSNQIEPPLRKCRMWKMSKERGREATSVAALRKGPGTGRIIT